MDVGGDALVGEGGLEHTTGTQEFGECCRDDKCGYSGYGKASFFCDHSQAVSQQQQQNPAQEWTRPQLPFW